MKKTLSSVTLNGFKLFKRGKVRDVFDLEDKLLIVSTDRISCFDVVLPTAIPCKGEVLTRLSSFWFGETQSIVPNHLITSDFSKFSDGLLKFKDVLENRTMLTKKAELIPFECVVRGYLSGSGWKEYQKSGAVCGIKLPDNLKESSHLPEPIFTPATKAEHGHDINITFSTMEDNLGKGMASELKKFSLELYQKASRYAEGKGIIIADTKFEFGLLDGKVILIDEALTPDSSRFWPRVTYKPGAAQPSFDKQFVRDYLETLDWDKTPPGPALPPHIVDETSRKYLEIYKLLTGQSLS